MYHSIGKLNKTLAATEAGNFDGVKGCLWVTRDELQCGGIMSSSAAKMAWTIISIILGYSLASGIGVFFFFLFVDISEAMEGSINQDFCSTLGNSSIVVPVDGGYWCAVNLDYVIFTLFYYPICIGFWQTLLGGLIVASVALWRQCRKFLTGVDTDHNLRLESMFPPIAIASTLYLLGVFILSGVYVVTRVVPIYETSWRGLLDLWPLYLPPIDVFSGFAWFFLLPPVPIFIAIAYLRKRIRI